MTTLLSAAFGLSLLAVAWVYLLYPTFLVALARLRPRPRRRAYLDLPVSVIVAAHDEEQVIEAKIRNVRESDYPAALIEVVIASDGSRDATVRRSRLAGADVILDLPRIGKLRALQAAVEQSTGELLVFTDADSMFEPRTLRELTANFADDAVGGVSANEVYADSGPEQAVTRGEGLYWRYEQLIKRLEDRVGSAVSASGRLYAIRRCAFVPSDVTAGTDDFVISTGVLRARMRLAYDDRSRVRVDRPADDGPELRRKVRVMNRGLRAAFSLGRLLDPRVGGLYSLQVLSHKILRRFVLFLLALMLASSVALGIGEPAWSPVVAAQLAFYGLALVGWSARARPWGRAKPLYVPYYFCLANLAAGMAVASMLRGVRFEVWEPAQEGRAGRAQVGG